MTTAEGLARQQESLQGIVESISSELDLRPLLTRIVRHACELLGADNGTIGLVDPERDVVRTEAIWQMPESELGAEMPRGVGLAGSVWAHGKPIVLQHYGQVAQPTQPDLAANAVIGLPIWWRERMIGFFGIGTDATRQTRTFTDDDVQTLALYARHAAVAIENARLYAETQRRLEELHLLYETSVRIGAALTLREVVTAYLDQVAAGGRYACTITRYEGDRVRVLGRWSPQEGLDLAPVTFPVVRDALDAHLDRGETVAMADVHTHPLASKALRRIQRTSGRPALALIPLRVGGTSRLGHVILSYQERHLWQTEELHRFEITAQQLAAALDSRLQHERLAAQEQQVAIFEERQRIARDLHDSVTQLLFSMTLLAQTTASAWKRDAAEGERRVARLVELSQLALAEMRALLAELRPPQTPTTGRELLESQGLVAALEAHLQVVGSGEGRVRFKADRYRPCAFAWEHALYRIAQEALANAQKHAAATTITLTLSTSPNGRVRLVVQDDGKGFDPHAPHVSSGPGTGLGLASMRERAAEAGGRLRLQTVEGGGTRVEVTFG